MLIMIELARPSKAQRVNGACRPIALYGRNAWATMTGNVGHVAKRM